VRERLPDVGRDGAVDFARSATCLASAPWPWQRAQTASGASWGAAGSSKAAISLRERWITTGRRAVVSEPRPFGVIGAAEAEGADGA
jgi:hypothetical protein